MLKIQFSRSLQLQAASAAAVFLFVLAGAQAQVVIAGSPKVGSANPLDTESKVSHPDTTPCVVPLFTNQSFANYSPFTFNYTPPADCPGPWAKVIFSADFTVTAGVQYDRTASIFLGHANIFYGTTAEPSSTVSPSWHVERDATNLSPIFEVPQSGEADIFNIVNSTYTGVIYADATLKFYPASASAPAAEVPDVVVPMPDAAGGAAFLYTSADQLSQEVTLPTNTERAYLEVIAQSQSADEFWYTCVPNDVTGSLESCGNTGFRETEISIDGIPAGIAPVYPWIYTGGIDPFLWRPQAGVETLNFRPYSVDLTPFAGVLANGAEHTVALSVFNSDSYFLVTANLLAFTDHGQDVVAGALVSNTLAAAPNPQVKEDLKLDANGNGTAKVSVTSKRNFAITGYVNTSRGKVTTTVAQEVDFNNTQNFTLSNTAYIQDIDQSNSVVSTTTTKRSSGTTATMAQWSYPLQLNIDVEVSNDGSESQTTTVEQDEYYDQNTSGKLPSSSYRKEQLNSTDTLFFDASGNFIGNGGARAAADGQHSSGPKDVWYIYFESQKGVLNEYITY